MKDYREYSPGVHKLIHHLGHLKSIVAKEHIAPIHISVWPTMKCQFKCTYCCCKNETDREKEIDLLEFKNALNILGKYGTKAVEFSGGGEPTLWGQFNEGVQHAYNLGMKVSLITNGLTLQDIPKNVIDKFSWIRVSLQSLRHAEGLNFKNVSTKISCSFIIPDYISIPSIKYLYDFAVNNNIIIRVATKKPCSESLEVAVEKEISKYPSHIFFSSKTSGKPSGCYMAWVRAAIDWRGNFLPCPAIHLNEKDEGKIPENFPLCHIRDIESWVISTVPHDLGYRCELCNCGKDNNDLIFNLLNGVEDVDFV
jgi:MoaA/NifB/PqqE/SkfB family radical SAM enzyme